MEQPRRKKKEEGPTNRRMNAIKHHHPAVFKDAFGNAKLGKFEQLAPPVIQWRNMKKETHNSFDTINITYKEIGIDVQYFSMVP